MIYLHQQMRSLILVLSLYSPADLYALTNRLPRHEVIPRLSLHRNVDSTEFPHQVDLVLLLSPCIGVTSLRP